MSFIYWLGTIYTVAVFAYLVYALFKPENF
ncbi:MAG TPA: K(+)-transporting ATPase subunit F [Usitatibacter sp.]|nr:K(+)-transporting ATPase subunit F [Usitatibacter sp.]